MPIGRCGMLAMRGHHDLLRHTQRRNAVFKSIMGPFRNLGLNAARCQ
jgi:hypothetical protein